MLKVIKSNEYVLSETKTEELLNDIKQFLSTDSDASSLIDSDIYNDTVRGIMAYRISLIVINNIKNELVKQGFVTVKYSSSIDGVVSVGWYDDKLVYGTFIE